LFIGCSKRVIGVGFPFEEEAGVGISSAIAYKVLKKEKKTKKTKTKNSKEGNKNQREAQQSSSFEEL